MLDVGIVIACYQYARFLGTALSSILAVAPSPRQVTIVDDGSSDGCASVASAFRGSFRASGIELRLVRHTINRGLAAARNSGIAKTETEWILCLDADDMLLPHALAELRSLGAAADVVMFGYQAFGRARGCRLYERHPDLLAAFRRGKRLGTACSPFRRSLWSRCPYDTSMIACEDTALWLRFARLGARFEVSRRPCVLVRHHPESLSRRVVAPNRAAIMRQLRAIAGRPSSTGYELKHG